MEEDILGAIERLSKAQNDIWYATLYSQEEQDEDIKILIKEYKNLQQIEQEHKKENGALREIIKELENSLVYMVNQFAYEDNNPKTKGSSLEKLYTGGLSALENAFNTLNIDEGIKREELYELLEEGEN